MKPNAIQQQPDTRLWKDLVVFPVMWLEHYDYNPRKVRRGLRVKLYHNRSNPNDPNAIRVHLEDGNRVLGYVPSHFARMLHRAKAMNCKFFAFINQHFPHESPHRVVWVRVKVLYPPVEVQSPEVLEPF